jgi:hypothetical protein
MPVDKFYSDDAMEYYMSDVYAASEPDPVTKYELDAAIADAGNLNAGDYTAASWAAFAGVLADAKAVSADAAATQADVDAALAALNAAKAALVRIAEPTSPTVVIVGPASIQSSDATATYTISAKSMPVNTGVIKITIKVEDAYFTSRSITALSGWRILRESDWAREGDYWLKTITLSKDNGAAAGRY